MFLTRLGFNSKMMSSPGTSQIDLPDESAPACGMC